MREYDIIAIGGGSGGIATMNRAGEYGAKAAVIEEKKLGGTCVNIGCVPKKIMWYGAQIAESIHKYGSDYGFTSTDATPIAVNKGHFLAFDFLFIAIPLL